MREQICYKLESGYFCVLTTKLLSHEFDREGNISNIRGLCSKAKMQTHHLLVQFLGMWALLFSLLGSISVESGLDKHST